MKYSYSIKEGKAAKTFNKLSEDYTLKKSKFHKIKEFIRTKIQIENMTDRRKN